MLEDLEKGDVAETIRIFFEKSNNSDVKPAVKSTLTLSQIDSFLDKLSAETTEVAQMTLFKSIATLWVKCFNNSFNFKLKIKHLICRCTGNDLKMIIRLLMHDLRINCGPKFM